MFNKDICRLPYNVTELNLKLSLLGTWVTLLLSHIAIRSSLHIEIEIPQIIIPSYQKELLFTFIYIIIPDNRIVRNNY